jgi:hypothetical protein
MRMGVSQVTSSVETIEFFKKQIIRETYIPRSLRQSFKINYDKNGKVVFSEKKSIWK